MLLASRGGPLKVMERDAERRTTSGGLGRKYRFDEARTLRAIVIRQRPGRWPCSGLTGTRASEFPQTPDGRRGRAYSQTRPLASNHADGGRAWPATRSPDRPSIPLGPVPARSHPAAATVAGHALFPRDEVEALCGRRGRGSFKSAQNRQVIDFTGLYLANAEDRACSVPIAPGGAPGRLSDQLESPLSTLVGSWKCLLRRVLHAASSREPARASPPPFVGGGPANAGGGASAANS